MDPSALSKAEIRSLAEEARTSKEMSASGMENLPEDIRRTLKLLQQQRQKMFAAQLERVSFFLSALCRTSTSVPQECHMLDSAPQQALAYLDIILGDEL